MESLAPRNSGLHTVMQLSNELKCLWIDSMPNVELFLLASNLDNAQKSRGSILQHSFPNNKTAQILSPKIDFAAACWFWSRVSVQNSCCGGYQLGLFSPIPGSFNLDIICDHGSVGLINVPLANGLQWLRFIVVWMSLWCLFHNWPVWPSRKRILDIFWCGTSMLVFGNGKAAGWEDMT